MAANLTLLPLNRQHLAAIVHSLHKPDAQLLKMRGGCR